MGWDDVFASDTLLKELMVEYDLVRKDYRKKLVHFYKVMYFDSELDAIQAAFVAQSFVFNTMYGVTYDDRQELEPATEYGNVASQQMG